MMVKRKALRMAVALRSWAALLCVFGWSPAQAVSFCASDVSTFKNALTLGSIQAQPYTIKLVQGTYAMDASLVYEFSAPTTIEGGYTANCAARVADPAANTVVDIGLGHTFDFRQLSGSPIAAINVDGLTFRNSNSGMFFRAGGSGVFSNDEGSVSLSRVRFTQISVTSQAYDPVGVLAYDGSVNLENVLVDHVGTTATCAVHLESANGASVTVNHVTADLAGGDDFCFADGGARAEMFIYNSILWNSDGGTSIFRGDSSASSTVAFFNDVFKGQSISGTPIFQAQINAAPGWINPAAGNYRLLTNPLSPAINSGTPLIFGGEPATDLEGHLRVTGSAPDRGAYESAFSDQSVLTVTNTLDSGAGSLRQAMLDANSSPSIAKSIQFNIRDGSAVPICPAVIALDTTLPEVSAPMSIDGYTQPLSSKNTDAAAFNATLCVMVKPAAGTLTTAFHVLADAASNVSLTLRGLGLGGFGQPVVILGGTGHVIAGNQFGGTANGVALPGAGLQAISIGVNASGSLIVGGTNIADRNVIVASLGNGINIQGGVVSTIDKCQIVNNLIGLGPDGHTVVANEFGINDAGDGCAIVRNRVAGNTLYNIWLNGGSGNVVQQNQVGITTQNIGVLNNAIGVLVTGTGNIIGAGDSGGALTANTVRFMTGGGVVIKGDAATGNSVNANLIYDNGATGNGMDIDLLPTAGVVGPTANDAGDADVGPNGLQNFPIGTQLVYTASGSIDRPATVSGVLDTLPGVHRIDAYFSSSANPSTQRGHAQVFLGRTTVNVIGGPLPFSLPILVPNQLAGGVISFTATDAAGNTSEIGTALSSADQSVFADGFE